MGPVAFWRPDFRAGRAPNPEKEGCAFDDSNAQLDWTDYQNHQPALATTGATNVGAE